MKPLHLKIAGLNSFREEQEVDFASLCESGVFGIFGPTGSGKSSVLDAITLALYGKVERAKNGTQGIINQNEDKLSVYFAFKVGETKYIAERTYRRGNDGSINQYSCRLMEIDEGGNNKVLAEKKREMDDKIQEIFGLTVDDFTRAVVLPQGKFQEFLTLQGSDRRKMLQRIFALERYGEQLIKRIREKLNKTQVELEMKKREQEILGDASENAIHQARAVLQEKQATIGVLEQKLALLKKEYEEYQEIRKLSQELQEVEKLLAQLIREEPTIKEKEEELRLAQKGEYLRPYLKQVNEGREKIDIKEIEKKTLEKELIQLQKERSEGEALFKAWEVKYQEEGKGLEGRIIKLEDAVEKEQKRDIYFEKLLQIRKDFKECQSEVKNLTGEIDKLKNSKSEKEIEKASLDEKLAEKEKIILQGEKIEQQRDAYQKLLQVTNSLEDTEKELKKKVKQRDIIEEQKAELLGQIQEIERSLTKIQNDFQLLPEPKLTLEEIYQEQTRLQAKVLLIENLRENENNISQKEKELAENLVLLSRQEQLRTEALLVMEQLAANKEALQKEISDGEEKMRQMEKESFTRSLRETLASGQPCPVCGSLEHPVLIDSKATDYLEPLEEISASIEVKKQELNLLEGEADKQNRVLVNTEAYLEVLQGKNAELRMEIQELGIRLENNRAKLPDGWKQETCEKLYFLINDEEKLLEKSRREREQWDKAKDDLNKNVQDYQNRLNALKQSLSAKNGELKLVLTEIGNLEKKYSDLVTEAEENNEYFVKLAGAKSGEEVEELFNLLKTSRIEMQKLQKDKDRALKEIDDLNTHLEEMGQRLQHKEQHLKGLEIDGKNHKSFCDELTAEINLITGGEKAVKVKAQAEAQLQMILNNLERYRLELEKAKKGLEEKTQAFHTLNQEIINLKNDLDKYQNSLQAKMAEYHFISLGHLEDALCNEAEREELDRSIKRYNDNKRLVQEQKKALLKKLADRKLTEEQWNQFLEQKSQAEAEEKQERTESIRLKHNLDDLEKKHVRWKELEQEILALTVSLDHLTTLDTLFKGNTFVEFIAEEQLMHVAIDASRRLGELTGYRYALEIDSEGGFIIRDDANGGLKRPVTTLSGGETFLTSLALALALSSQIQLRGKYPLEFFFLDEGFGTLDNHLLETVMNSLERLQLEKMTIGIISHVPELKARIPRSLMVEPAEKGGRGTRLKLESL